MKVVYFDLDGTLIDSAQCSVISAQATFRKFCNLEVDAQKITEKMGVPIEVSFPELSRGAINAENWDEAATYFRGVYKENSDIHTKLFGGVEDFLRSIRPCVDAMYVVTSKKSQPAENNLKALGIMVYFNGVIGSDRVEHYKPHPDPIFKARALLPGIPARQIMVGDADTDIIMGRAANIKTCAVTWGAHDKARLKKANPDYIVDTVADLQKTILEFNIGA